MKVNRKVWTGAFWATAVVALMVLGAFQAGGSLSTAFSTGAQAGGTAAATLPATASSDVGGGAPVAATASPDTNGPHPGTLDVYEVAPQGATSEDPAVAYDTVSYEPILNVYQTLVSYNGSSTASFVPTLATCVPLQGDQCAEDYGSGFTGVFNSSGDPYTGSNGIPVYWTFVIDPAARFYDPSTGGSWAVYPSDVMFSIARTLIWSTYPYAGRTAGWIIAQSLLPFGNATWDGGLHSPYNNTPEHVYSSMLVNDSAFCPASAMNGVKGNGCITFVANGSGSYWPEFLDFVEDNLGASVVPCGWFTAAGGNVTGWSGTKAAKGDGSCLLPDGGNATNTTQWSTYLSSVAALGPKYWDNMILLESNYPSPQSGVRWTMVGSGPYYASVTPGEGYQLAANPKYAQPSGCSGAGGLAVYTGYCDPAAGGYISSIKVTWETAKEGDSLGTDAIEAGTADFAGIDTTQTTTLLGYVHAGLWQYDLFPTISDAFTTINLGVDYSAYNTTFSGTPLEANPIPPDLFTSLGLRNFYIAAYPYTTIENTINTVDGIQFIFEAGGPIPVGMGNYYPSNVSWPYLLGDPTQSSSVVGSAAWWFSELTTPSTPYYNATFVTQCTSSNPCTFPVGYLDVDPANLALTEDWDAEVYALSGHRLSPWPLAESFTAFVSESLIGPYESPLVATVGGGWAPDYPDPTDYVAPITQADGAYTGPDTVSQQLLKPANEENASCGHYGLSTPSGAFANLSYWANVVQNPADGDLGGGCQGVAYNVANYFMGVAGALSAGPQRILDYNLIEQITTALGLYVWNGQSNELIGFAPWINPASVNENPVIGGGGDIVWFQIHYRSVYTPTITETGLPAGTTWSASVGGLTKTSTGPSIAFAPEPNATYNYTIGYVPGYTVTPSSGTFPISGAPVTQSATYTAIAPGTKTVKATFNETGIVTGVTWSLALAGFGSQSTAGGSLVYELPESATYTYAPLSIVGYVTPATGAVVVGTSPTYTTISYVSVFGATYQIVFTQTGLSNGTSWSVTLGSAGSAVTLSSTTPTIVFTELNGSLNYSIGVPGGYSVEPKGGTVTVAGADRSANVAFFKTTTPAWDYLSPLAYGLIGALAVLMLIGFGMASRNARRGRPSKSPETWTGSEQQPPSGGGGTPPPPPPESGAPKT
jgi:hypothetical protein